jgi:hypothetical protein
MKIETINKVKELYSILFEALEPHQYFFKDDKFHLNVDEWGDGNTTFEFDINEKGELVVDEYSFTSFVSSYDEMCENYSNIKCRDYIEYPNDLRECIIRRNIYHKYVKVDYPIDPHKRAKLMRDITDYLFLTYNILVLNYKEYKNDLCGHSDPFLITSDYQIKDECICFNDCGKERIVPLSLLDEMLFVNKDDYTPDLKLELGKFEVESEITNNINDIVNRYI